MSSQPTTYTTYTTDRGYYWYAGVRHAQIGQCKGCSVSGVSGVSGQWVSLHKWGHHHQFNGQTVITGAGPRVSRLWFGNFYLLLREFLPFGSGVSTFWSEEFQVVPDRLWYISKEDQVTQRHTQRRERIPVFFPGDSRLIPVF